MNSPWGIKAFKGYLGDDVESWKSYDTFELIKIYNGPKLEILIDQGSEDAFKEQLKTEILDNIDNKNIILKVSTQSGYDHS